VAPAVLVLALAALRVRRVLVLSAAGLTLLGYAVVACVGVRFLGEGTLFPLLPGAGKVVWDFTLEDVLFGVYGLALWGAVGVAAWRLCRRPNGRPRPDDWFLALWLGLEAGGFLALSPFPAVRRVMGTVVVLTLLAGRLASRTCRHGPRRQLVRVAVALGVLLGLLFWAVDFRAANAQRQAVRRAADCIAPEMNGRETVWYTGHWGFQFYAERAGMRPVVLGEPLRRDDWLVVPDEQIDQQEMRRDGEPLRLVREVVIDDRQPLQTVPFYYIGNVGLGHRRLPYLRVRVYRVTAGFVPRSGP
jgi:hypothetical protein